MSRDRNLDRDSRGWATVRMKFDSKEADLIERAAEIRHLESQ